MTPHPVLNGFTWVTQSLSLGEVSLSKPECSMLERVASYDWMNPEIERELGNE